MIKYNTPVTLSSTTTVDYRGIIRLFRENLSAVIAHETSDAFLQHETTSEHDLGFGKLVINVEGDEIGYNFIPSEQFEKDLISAFNGKDPLIKVAEDLLTSRYLNIYENIL